MGTSRTYRWYILAERLTELRLGPGAELGGVGVAVYGCAELHELGAFIKVAAGKHGNTFGNLGAAELRDRGLKYSRVNCVSNTFQPAEITRKWRTLSSTPSIVGAAASV